MAQVNTSGGTSFSELKSAYVAGGLTDGSGNASLRDGSTTSSIDLSDFRNANFNDGTSIPGSGSISIGTRFLNGMPGRTFGSGTVTLTGVAFTSPATTANGLISEEITFTAAPVPSNATGTITYAFTSSTTDADDPYGIPDTSGVYNTSTQMNYTFTSVMSSGSVNVIVSAKQNGGTAVGPTTTAVTVTGL
jgi:hypothetical protein